MRIYKPNEEIAAEVDTLDGKEKKLFEEDPDGYIMSFIKDEDTEKCIYASLPDKPPYYIEEDSVCSYMVCRVVFYSNVAS